MQDLAVIDKPSDAAVLLDPIRSRILSTLRAPGSASTVASALGLTRQKVNYHLRTLEDHGLVELVEERPRRGLTERIMLASARSYLVSPAALGVNAPNLAETDRLSSSYLIAVAARIVREVADLSGDARTASKSLPTLTIATDIRFGSAQDRAAFTVELSNAVTEIVAKYHNDSKPDGRWHRLTVGAYPRPK